jgi:hypothetical protein
MDDEILGGQRAHNLLTNPAFDKALADVEQAITQAWANAPIRDKEAQHELKLMHKLLRDVRANLERAVTDGKLAVQELQRTEERRNPLRRIFAR